MLSRDDTRFAGYLIAGYLAFAEVLSWETSKWPACLVVSEYQSADNHSSNQTCATFYEGIMRGLIFLWDHATHDNIIALGTVLIAIFTWTLWRSTSRLWNATKRSAEIAERALTDLEAPFIAVKIIKPGLAWDMLKTSLTWGPHIASVPSKPTAQFGSAKSESRQPANSARHEFHLEGASRSWS